MKAPRRSRARRAGAVAAAVAVAAATASCAWSGGDGTAERGLAPPRTEYRNGMIGNDPGGRPVRSGTLTVGTYSEAALVDPAEANAAGASGGIEMSAIFDVLMRWDSGSDQLRPQLAKGLRPDDDHRTWTLSLRDGVRFSDGTTLDSAAVKWSIDRYVKKGGDEAMLWKQNVASIETPGASTVIFRLRDSWPTFGYRLSTGAGMIVARSADSRKKFKPVGAGPYTYGRYAAQEELVLNARRDYWGGRPNVDRVRFVIVNDPNALLDTLVSGRIDIAFLREPSVIEEALDAGYPGFMNVVALGNVAIINGQKGRPGHDPRVRRAMGLAIQPEVIRKRAAKGAGLAGKELFPKSSPLHNDVAPQPYDPGQARELLKQAKKDGYDGKISYVDGQDPASRATALSLKAMLENVGFEVELDLVRSVADQIKKTRVSKDYDVSGWGVNWRDNDAYARMFMTSHTKGDLRGAGPAGAKLDALIEEFRSAGTPAAQRELMGRIQRQWNEDIPNLVFGPAPEFIAWRKNVRGVKDTLNSMVLLDRAWVDRAAG